MICGCECVGCPAWVIEWCERINDQVDVVNLRLTQATWIELAANGVEKGFAGHKSPMLYWLLIAWVFLGEKGK